MEHRKEHLLSRVKKISSMLYTIILWIFKLSYAIYMPRTWPSIHHLQLSIFALVASNIHSFMVSLSSSTLASSSSSSASSSSFPSSSSSLLLNSSLQTPSSLSTMGDMIGTESGIYMSSGENMLLEGSGRKKPYSRIHKKQDVSFRKKEYPPPMPLLPWTLTREYTDGRLILRKRSTNHEYLASHRENGRLVMKLVALEDNFMLHHQVSEKVGEVTADGQNMDDEIELEIEEDSKVVDKPMDA